MPARTVFAVTLVIGFVALAVVMLVNRAIDPVPEESTAPSTDARVTDSVEALTQRVERLSDGTISRGGLEKRIQAVEERLASLEGRMDGLDTGVAELKKESGGPDLTKLDDEQLAILARAAQGRRDYGAAIDAWKALLDRDLEGEERTNAMHQLGFAYRGLKDHVHEEEVFRKLVDELGPDTTRGAWARFQLAWSRFYQDDVRDARDRMEKLTRVESADAATRNWSRMWTADFSIRLSEPDVARPILEGIIRDLAEPENQNERQLLDLAKRRLGEIGG